MAQSTWPQLACLSKQTFFVVVRVKWSEQQYFVTTCRDVMGERRRLFYCCLIKDDVFVKSEVRI